MSSCASNALTSVAISVAGSSKHPVISRSCSSATNGSSPWILTTASNRLAGRSLDAVEGFAASGRFRAVFGGGHNGLSAESFDGADDPFVVARHVTVGEKGVRFFVDRARIIGLPARSPAVCLGIGSMRTVPVSVQEFHVFRFFNGRRAADAESFTGLNALQI